MVIFCIILKHYNFIFTLIVCLFLSLNVEVCFVFCCPLGLFLTYLCLEQKEILKY